MKYKNAMLISFLCVSIIALIIVRNELVKINNQKEYLIKKLSEYNPNEIATIRLNSFKGKKNEII